MKDYEKAIKATGVLLVAAIAFVIYKGITGNSAVDRTRLYALLCIVVIVALLLIVQRYTKKLNGVNDIFKNDENTDEYIAMCENKYNEAKSDREKQLWLINMSIGYKNKNDYNKMVEALERVDISKTGSFDLVYYNNLAFAYFMLDRDDEGIKIIEKHKKPINKSIRKKQNSLEFLLTLSIFALKKKAYEDSLYYIGLSGKYMGFNYTNEEFEVIRAWVLAETGQKDEATKMLFEIINDDSAKRVKTLAQNIFNKVGY